MDTRVEQKRAVFYSFESHRNGVGGMSFYLVRFSYDNEDLIGILYTTGDVGEPETKVDDHTCVINPAREDAAKRGYDYFGDWMLKQVSEHYDAYWKKRMGR
jgi:hypothetical protein